MASDQEAILIVEGGPKDGETIRLEGITTVMGRQLDNDVVESHGSVSRHHALIVRSDLGHALRDLSSRNGTFIGGKRVTGDYLLKDGDTVRLGSSGVSYVFESPWAETLQITVDEVREVDAAVTETVEVIDVIP